ncbi:hypothetical protein [Vitreoscilla sp. C1]|nr:hypothetical protein [Vitreoscilla sp. C1]
MYDSVLAQSSENQTLKWDWVLSYCNCEADKKRPVADLQDAWQSL